MRNIYLIGMMGSGKTTTGRELARLLSLSFIDLDDQIVERTGKSINDIFSKEGEPYFRSIENELLMNTSHQTDRVVATGGGIVINAFNRERMKSTGLVVYLKTSLDVLWERVKGKMDRPLLRGMDPKKALANLFYERTPLYEMSSDKIFLTDHKSSEAVATEIYKTCFGKR
ncbi:MAG: shikimate kinase [Candidatus Omnitrophica bacterium]|nr:shikimate kinase [Candidatus Omnitrophota bacterium]